MNSKLSNGLLLTAPFLGGLIYLGCRAGGLPHAASACAWIAVICAIWWIFECTDIAITGLVPMVALPLMGVVDAGSVAASYGHPMIWLLMGGFFLSQAMRSTGTHRRIALTMVRAVGGRGGRRLIFGFMIATATLSMWISNAATTLMMLPIALAVVENSGDPKLRTPLLLGIAYAASLGGMATPIGTPPNVIMMAHMQSEYGIDVDFLGWMSIGIPIVVILLPIAWWWVSRNVNNQQVIEMPVVGRPRPEEIRVLIIFTVAALAWMLRKGPAGGWTTWLGIPTDATGKSLVDDATIAVAASMLLFLCPRGKSTTVESLSEGDECTPTPSSQEAPQQASSKPNIALPRTLLDWPTAVQIPWGILLMFGGGLALGSAFKSTGLSAAIGAQLSGVSSMSPWFIIVVVCLMMNFLTEITSSTATANLMMPVLGALAVAADIAPMYLLVPATISCSCAFMLPVATAPNVIVFGAGGLPTNEMAKRGIVLNLVAAVVIVGVSLSRLTP